MLPTKQFIAILLCAFAGLLQAGSVSMFPLCAEIGSKESDRLNSFHVFFKNLNSKVKFEKLELTVHDLSKVGCDATKRRTAAIVSNSEKYIKGTYLVKGDSIIVKFETLYSKFIDKGSEEKVITGAINKFDDVINKLVGKICSGIDVSVTPDQWKTIFAEIKTDGAKYVLESNTENLVDNFEIGKLAFESQKYAQAISNLVLVKPTHSSFSEALYIIGKCYISTEEFGKALEYFSKTKEAKGNFDQLEEYIKAAKTGTKPYFWFDTREKRLQWWTKLKPEETLAVITLMNNLKIKNKVYDGNYTYVDDDIVELFKTTKLHLKNVKLENFEIFKHFTNTDVVIFENCKYTNLTGFSKLYNLRIIRAQDNGIKKSSVASFIEENKIIVLITQ